MKSGRLCGWEADLECTHMINTWYIPVRKKNWFENASSHTPPPCIWTNALAGWFLQRQIGCLLYVNLCQFCLPTCTEAHKALKIWQVSVELVSQVFGIMVFKHFKANYCKTFPEDTHSCESAWTLKSNLKLHIMKKQHTTLYSYNENNKDSKQPGQSNNYHIPQ